MSDTSLKRAIAVIGGPAKVAALFNISSQAVSQWDKCPPDRCIAVEAASGVSRHDLRPDIFGAPPKRRRAA